MRLISRREPECFNRRERRELKDFLNINEGKIYPIHLQQVWKLSKLNNPVFEFSAFFAVNSLLIDFPCGKEQFHAMDIKELCGIVRQTSYEIHVYHGHGHVEKVYENALAHRLRKLGLEVRQQFPINVYDEDDTLIGQFTTDLLVDGRLVAELKTAKALAPEHEAQILGYLKSARVEHGLLINFGSYKFQIRKFAWSEYVQSLPVSC